MKITIDVPVDRLEEVWVALEAIGISKPAENQLVRGSLLSLPPYRLPLPKNKFLEERTRNVLKNAYEGGISGNRVYTIRDLCQLTEAEFLRVKNGGKKVLEYLRVVLAAKGLRFNMTPNDLIAYEEGRFKLDGS